MTTISPPHRILLGPGPSIMDYRVYRALTTPITGHMDGEFLRIISLHPEHDSAYRRQ